MLIVDVNGEDKLPPPLAVRKADTTRSVNTTMVNANVTDNKMWDFHGHFGLSRPFSLPQIGQFFGEVDPVLMINLVNTSLYSFNKTYDYQSVCDPEKDSKAAAGPRSVYVVRRGHSTGAWFTLEPLASCSHQMLRGGRQDLPPFWCSPHFHDFMLLLLLFLCYTQNFTTAP